MTANSAGTPAWAWSDLPIIRQQLSLAKGVLTERFSQLSAHGDNRSYHGLGVVATADEEAVMGGLASIIEGLEQYNKWSAGEQALTAQRYLQHCKEATEKAERLQDNKKALAESRRLLERHTGRSSRRKFLEQLEAIAHDANVTFFCLESDTSETTEGEPTHCLSGQTFVLDLCVDKEGMVSWAKFQRILTNGSMVPDEANKEGWMYQQWQALNKDICEALHSTDMERALKGKFRVLHRVEDVHSKHPEAAVYDALHALEVSMLEAHEAARAATQSLSANEQEEAWRTGMGVIKRLVEGLRMEYMETVGAIDEPVKCYALLQLEGVALTPGEDAKEPPKPTMSLVLDPPVPVCSATAGLLQGLVKGAADVRISLIKVAGTPPTWDAMVCRPAKRSKISEADDREGARMAGGLVFFNSGRPTGAVEISRVPVASAAHISTALMLLRQQLVLNELHASCFQEDDTLEDGKDSQTSLRNVEVSASPPGLMFLHVSDSAKGAKAKFGLMSIEIKVDLGGVISARLHAQGKGPCSDEYATRVLSTCRNVPLALGCILGTLPSLK